MIGLDRVCDTLAGETSDVSQECLGIACRAPVAGWERHALPVLSPFLSGDCEFPSLCHLIVVVEEKKDSVEVQKWNGSRKRVDRR